MKKPLKNVAIMLMLAYGTCPPLLADEFVAQMEAENARWLAVYKSQDAQAFGPMYAPDAILIAQGNPSIEGRTAIVQFWFEMLKKGFLNPALEIINLRQEGKIAYQTCRWSVLQPKENGVIQKITGHTLRIFERQQDGRWLIKVQMSNNDEAAITNRSSSASILQR
ncbi:DUF4440 domain-containing protein [Noviherbaspirillum sp. 1P10PC]|uniref:YybH family protein n=1 Tax=Noviherbaspirillum sp. 1P10PC TaxID=3132292 RepID=UPI00399F28B1